MNDLENGMVVGAQDEWDERYGDSGYVADDTDPQPDGGEQDERYG